MADEKRKPKRNCHPWQKWLPAAAAILLLVLLAVGFGVRYISFVSQTIYQESTSHLEEVLHKSNNMLKEMVRKNLTYLHLYNDFLENTSDEAEIQAYIEKAQQSTGFVGFYFLTYDGNYMTVTGETGYLGLQTNLDEKLSKGEDIVMNTALPGKPQMLAFICPETQGSYRGFAYDAIAIAYYNDAVLKLLDNSAFEGNASNYVIYPDGRVIIDNSVNRKETVYNFLAMLREHSDLSEKQVLALSDAFAQGSSGNMRVTLGGISYYLVYEGAAVQNWTMLGLVPVRVVNAGLDKLWFHTIQIVAGITVGIAVLVILMIVRRGHANLRRKNTEISYRDELFKKLSLNVDDVFLMLDAETAKVDYVSPNIERLLGIPWKEARQDARVLAALHPKDSPDRDKNYLEGLLSGQQREWDDEYAHLETGERRWFHIVAMGSDVEGRTKHILVMSDRTADKQVNQALSDAVAAAETANRAKSTFLSNMSHDIRTPMNAIIGFTTLAISNIDDKDRVKDYLTKTLASSNHLLSLINDVLDMSRIESGRVTLETKPVYLPDLVHDIRDIVQSNIVAKRLSLFIDTIDVVDEQVIADPMRLNQILLNILSNAVKFTPTDGMVSLRIVEKPTAPKGYADYEFHIRDNGIGISEEFRKHIFEQFSREETSTVSKTQGTGLGMSITKSLVDMMGGTITVESEPGKGSEFVVALRFPVSGEKREPKQIAQLEGLRALVADDDINACLNVSKMLRSIGMRPDWTISGKEAVIRAKDAMEQGDAFSVYIIDWLIPDMNGIEVVHQVRKIIGDATPIIILTAYDWTDIETEAKAAGVTAFCAKPLFMSELRSVLAKPFGAEDASAMTEKGPDFSGKKLLLVEDNELNLEIASTILQEAGFEVDTAENGQIALEKVENAPADRYDLILMDIQMPVMDGYEATRRIRALPDKEKASVPIVAMTANAFEDDRKNALNAGMNGHIAKPLDLPKLFRVLSELMR